MLYSSSFMPVTIALKLTLRYAILVAYPLGIFVWLRHFPQEQTIFAILGCSCFYILYLAPIVLFSADMELTEQGLVVRRMRAVFIPFSQIRFCLGVFLIPFQFVVVLAELNSRPIIALTLDSLPERRHSVFQRGRLARAINERVGGIHT